MLATLGVALDAGFRVRDVRASHHVLISAPSVAPRILNATILLGRQVAICQSQTVSAKIIHRMLEHIMI